MGSISSIYPSICMPNNLNYSLFVSMVIQKNKSGAVTRKLSIQMYKHYGTSKIRKEILIAKSV